jgi:hypothetical protein
MVDWKQIRKEKSFIKKQAEVMQTRSKRYLPEVNIGDFVTLPIPEVDKGLTEAPNIICRIIDIDYQYSLYELACEIGVFMDLFSRNAFDLVQNCQLDIQVQLDEAQNEAHKAENDWNHIQSTAAGKTLLIGETRM